MTSATETVIDSLLSAISAKNGDAYESVKDKEVITDALDLARQYDADGFYFKLLYPFETIVHGLLQQVTPHENARLVILHSHFIDAHLCNLFRKLEGNACCADKARTIISRVLKFYATGETISFDTTAQYTFHYPKTILTTHEAIISYVDSLLSLQYGNYEPYLTQIALITNAGSQQPG